MCTKSRGALTRLGLVWGVSALVALLVAYVSGSWLYTKEPVMLPDSQTSTFITFQIGLWRVCYDVKGANLTAKVPSSSCSIVKYTSWEEVQTSDLEIWTTLDLAQVFISRMRSSTILSGSAIFLLLLATFFAFLGHFNNDNKTVIACGLFIVGGLCLGMGLVAFASAISETLTEIFQYHREPPSGPIYEYHYGWCFLVAGLAFIMDNMAALFSILGYLSRFPSVDEMVRQMVPGAERKLLEHQHLSTEYLVRHLGPVTHQYDILPTQKRSKYDSECGPLLNKTPPDVCTTNKIPDFGIEDIDPLGMVAGVIEPVNSVAHTLAGQTVPITIKNSMAPLSFCDMPNKYGTIHHSGGIALHQDFLAVAELEGSTSFSGYHGRSKTLQPRSKKKCCVAIETFQVPEADFAEYGGRRTNDFEFSGSAV